MKDTSGAAFPNEITEEARLTKGSGRRCHELLGGMTLLQYYAGEAMQEILRSHLSHSDEPDFQCVALYSLKQAEAMIAEYERRYGDG